MRTFIVAIVLAAIAGAQPAPSPCEPPGDVAAAIGRVEILRRDAPSDLFTTQAREILDPILREHPGDVFANLAFLELFREKGHPEIIASYRSALEAHPGDPRYQLFYAASLIGSDTPEALRRLTGLTASNAGFPFPYLLIGQIREYPKFADHALAAASLLKFVKACPTYLPAYSLLAISGTGEELQSVTETLRALLQGRMDFPAVVAYGSLWRMEFRSAPPAAYTALRTRVQQDIDALRTPPVLANPAALKVLREGYRLSGNNGAANFLPPPPPREPVYEAYQQWLKEHPSNHHASPAEAQAYNRDLAKAARTWIVKWPGEPMPYHMLFRALSEVSDTTAAELTAAAQQLIAINRRRPARFLNTPAIIDVAQVYCDRGISLDLVPSMLETGLREIETRPGSPECDFFDDRNHRLNEEFRHEGRIYAYGVKYDLSLKTSNFPAARQALAAMRNDLDLLVPVTTQPGHAAYLDSQYWTKMAGLADLEHRPADSAKYLKLAAQARNPPAPVESAPAAANDPQRRLPPFRATGLDGKLWTAADLEGKVALMNLWATWCVPCIEELPYFQKLYDQLKDKANLVVLSLNIDSNPGLVEPFLKGRGFTVPVLLANGYAGLVSPDMSIPRTWIVKAGILRGEEVGFGAPDSWMARISAKVDEVNRP